MKFKVNIFKTDENYTAEEIIENIKKKMENNKLENIIYQKHKEFFGKDELEFHFFFGKKDCKNSRIEWYEQIRNIFDQLEDERKEFVSTYGILIVNMKIKDIDKDTGEIFVSDKVTYILTFGYGINIIEEGIDMNYGLDMASKMARKDSINTQSSKFFSLNKSKSLVIYNSANFNTQIGEAVDYMIAKIEEYGRRTAIKQLLELLDEEVTFSTCIKISLTKEFNEENLYKVLKNLYIVWKSYNERIAIPKLKFLGKKDEELKKQLDEKLKKVIIEKDNSSISIGTYIIQKGQIQILENQNEYELYVNKQRKRYNSLTIEEVKNFMKDFKIDDITKIKVRINKKDTKELYSFIDFTTTLDNDEHYYCLSGGKWTRFNKEYIKKVNEEIQNKNREIVKFDDELTFNNLQELRKKYSMEITKQEYDESKNSALYDERVYNYFVRDKIGGKLLDRKLDNTIEIADVLDLKEKALIHTKIGSPGNFIECISQSRNGARHYLYNTTAVIKKFGNELEEIRGVTLLLVITNKTVWETKNIGNFKSLRFKLELLSWYDDIQEMNFKPKIIISKKES